MDYTLSLTEYSAKYDVSVSTLRRKIKKSAILNKMVEGKYLLPDVEYRDLATQNVAPPKKKEVVIAPPQEQNDSQETTREYKGEDLEPLLEVKFDESSFGQTDQDKQNQDSFSELKSAFRMILSEKEDQITTLKSYVADLQTLNKVLEGELERLESLGKKSVDHRFDIDFE
jgi:hypothetical protein